MNAMLMPALWGGVTIGLLSALPVVGAGNCCCCLWVVSGGVVAAYLLQANTAEPVALGDGALAGLLAGLFGAVVYAVVSVPVTLVTGPFQQRLFRGLTERLQDVPDSVRQALDGIGTSEASVFGMVTAFVFMLIAGAVFASLGGLLGAVFFRKNPESRIPNPEPRP
ncbi:MAG: hypothetical protein AB1806_16245 [Acidobacteriota bacterium]